MDHGTTIPNDLMHRIDREAKLNGHKVFYSDAGEYHYEEVEERFEALFKTARKNASAGRMQIRRLLLCDADPIRNPKKGLRYFVPPSHKGKATKFFRIILSVETIYELAEHYRVNR